MYVIIDINYDVIYSPYKDKAFMIITKYEYQLPKKLSLI